MSSTVENYYVSFSGKSANLYEMENKRLVRRFTVAADIVNAQVSGAGKNARIAITMVGGKTWIYSSDGRLIRK